MAAIRLWRRNVHFGNTSLVTIRLWRRFVHGVDTSIAEIHLWRRYIFLMEQFFCAIYKSNSTFFGICDVPPFKRSIRNSWTRNNTGTHQCYKIHTLLCITKTTSSTPNHNFDWTRARYGFKS